MNPPADFDGAWKDALPDALAFFFPTIHADIDWSQPPRWLDKELQSITPANESGPLTVDVLLELTERGGTEALVIVHIEVQSQTQQRFARRMFVYHYRLAVTYEEPVVSLAILGDTTPDWKPERYEQRKMGNHELLEYPAAKLLDYNMAELATNPNPFAPIVLGHRAAQATRTDTPERVRAKVELVRGLHTRGYTADQVRALFTVLDRLLRLPDEDEEVAWQQIVSYEEVSGMPYITSAERIGHRKGLAEGIEVGRIAGEIAGQHRNIGALLESKFGDAGRVLLPQVVAITDPMRLQNLVGIIVNAPSVEAVRETLA